MLNLDLGKWQLVACVSLIEQRPADEFLQIYRRTTCVPSWDVKRKDEFCTRPLASCSALRHVPIVYVDSITTRDNRLCPNPLPNGTVEEGIALPTNISRS